MKLLSIVLVGFITGVMCFIFGSVLIFISENTLYQLVVFLPLVGLLCIYIYDKFGDEYFEGMNRTLKSIENPKIIIEFRYIVMITITTWIAHLFGASVGREGVAVQIGVSNAQIISRKFKIKEKEFREILLSSGIAAGFAGLFGTPIAGIFFANFLYQENNYNIKTLSYFMVASFSAFFTSTFLGLNHFHVDLILPTIDLYFIIICFIAIIIFLLVGKFFIVLLEFFKEGTKRIFSSRYKRMFFFSILLSVFLLITNGRYNSLGLNLIEMAFYAPEEILYIDFLFKLIATTFALSIGFQGGEVTPLFAIGSALGVTIAMIFGVDPIFLASLGYVLVFASATRAYVASIFLGIGIFGIYVAPFLIIAAIIGTKYFNEKTIYLNKKN